MTNPDDAAEAWAAHFARKRAERLAEADRLWAALAAAGHREGMALLLDFTLFGRDEQGARALAAQVTQTYATQVAELPGEGWRVIGTTRPYGTRLTEAGHRDWVAYVFDLGQAHGLVFSAWNLDAPQLGVQLSSLAFETRED